MLQAFELQLRWGVVFQACRWRARTRTEHETKAVIEIHIFEELHQGIEIFIGFTGSQR